jgi:hypothetical protein
MRKARGCRRVLLSLTIACGVSLAASAQNNHYKVTQSDIDAAAQSKSVTHALAVKNEHGDLYKGAQKLHGKVKGNRGGLGPVLRYPADLQNHGGAVLPNTVFHAIYLQPDGVNCPVATCWGNPEGFLSDLGKSSFIDVVDQYVGSNGSGRYSVGDNATVSWAAPSRTATQPSWTPTAYSDNDMLAVIHSVAVQTGETGYGHFYHVFLPPGTDECQDDARTTCYSPDDGNTWFFCAYHGSVDFSDIGHVIYSVEPYQNVGGCAVKPGTPNGQLVDSTNSVLSHEVIEAITDPDLDAWWNSADNGIYGEEIGDECSFLAFDNQGNYLGFDPSVWQANGHKYATQPEYSNFGHACVAIPRGW